jgi:hypothetical protein
MTEQATLPLFVIDLIASYLARAMALGPNSAPADYVEANRLMIHLAILLPAGLYRTVRDGVEAGDQLGLWSAILSMRAMLSAQGSLDLGDATLHVPPAVDRTRLN